MVIVNSLVTIFLKCQNFIRMLSFLLTLSLQTEEVLTPEKLPYQLTKSVEKGDVLDLRMKSGHSGFALVSSVNSRFYLDIGSSCNSVMDFKCKTWYNSKQNGFYMWPTSGLSGDYYRLIFTAATPGKVRIIIGQVENLCRESVTVLSGSSISKFTISHPSDFACVISGDPSASLSCGTQEALDVQQFVEVIYPNMTSKNWSAGNKITPPVETSFVRITSEKVLSHTLTKPNISSNGSKQFNFGEFQMSKIVPSSQTQGWTTDHVPIELESGQHTEDEDPETSGHSPTASSAPEHATVEAVIIITVGCFLFCVIAVVVGCIVYRRRKRYSMLTTRIELGDVRDDESIPGF